MFNEEEIFCTITLIISWITSKYAKKAKWFEDYLIPVQNLLIGISIATTKWFFTNDFHASIAFSGLCAGGIYDVLHNINIILKKLLEN